MDESRRWIAGKGWGNMNWLREILSDDESLLSSKRVSMLMATASLSIAEIILAVAALYGNNVDMALAAVSVPLAGIGGYSYVRGMAQENKNAGQPLA